MNKRGLLRSLRQRILKSWREKVWSRLDSSRPLVKIKIHKHSPQKDTPWVSRRFSRPLSSTRNSFHTTQQQGTLVGKLCKTFAKPPNFRLWWQRIVGQLQYLAALKQFQTRFQNQLRSNPPQTSNLIQECRLRNVHVSQTNLSLRVLSQEKNLPITHRGTSPSRSKPNSSHLQSQVQADKSHSLKSKCSLISSRLSSTKLLP